MKAFEGVSVARLEPAASSAFRALGLAAGASQEEIFGAAEALGLALKLGVKKRFETDLEWLGPVRRAEADVRDALGRLSDPPQRAAERLFWFHRVPKLARPLTTKALRQEADSLAASGGPAARHDAALLLLAALHVLDPQLREAAAWAEAFRLWRETVEWEEFWSLLVASDLKGEFEQVLTFTEAAELRARTPRLVSKALAGAAHDALLAEDFERCGRALALLRAASLPQALLDEYENEVLGPFEEQAESACDLAFGLARLFTHDTNMLPSSRKRYFDEALHKFEREAKPELLKFHAAAGGRGFHLRRLMRHAAGCLVELAGFYRAEGWAEQALHVCRAALALAPPGSTEAAEAAEALRAAGAEPDERTEEAYAARLERELFERHPPATLFDDPRAARSRPDNTFKGGLAYAAFFALLLASCFALDKCGVIKLGRSPRYTPSIYNFNSMNFNVRAPVPQITPFPTPILGPKALGVESVPPAELRRLLNGRQAVVIDVRPRAEYEAGHVAGALSVPEEEVEARAATLVRRGRRLICYGSAANPYRAMGAALALRIKGHRNVALLEGGYEGWVAAGLPTETSLGTVTPPAEVAPSAPPKSPTNVP